MAVFVDAFGCGADCRETAASNTDPFATTPAEAGSWLVDGPHLMVIVPNPDRFDPFPSDQSSGGPYVMWKGTWYAYVMVPIGDQW